MGAGKKRLNTGALTAFSDKNREITDLLNRELSFCDDSVCREQDLARVRDGTAHDSNFRHVSANSNGQELGKTRPDIERQINESKMNSMSEARRKQRIRDEVRKRAAQIDRSRR